MFTTKHRPHHSHFVYWGFAENNDFGSALGHCQGHMRKAIGSVRARLPDEPTDSSIDNVISAVDVNGIASDKPGRIMSQERRCGADVFDAD